MKRADWCRWIVAVAIVMACSNTIFAYEWVEWSVNEGGNGHLYARTNSIKLWNDAELEAVAAGGHLVSIQSAEENLFVYTHFVEPMGQNHWIGLTDQAQEGTFVWSSGEPVTYTKWAPNAPNNASNLPTGEDHVWMGRPTAEIPGSWDDVNGTIDNINFDGVYGIIEVVPEPASLCLFALGGLAVIRRKRQ